MAAPSPALFFRIVYRSLYLFLCLLIIALLLVSPGDIINQSRQRENIYPILIVAASYVGTVLIVIFVYFIRLYINRSVMHSIPRAWVPIEKGDVRKEVRHIITAGLSRSAAVAFVSRPRTVRGTLLKCDATGGIAKHRAAAVVEAGSVSETRREGGRWREGNRDTGNGTDDVKDAALDNALYYRRYNKNKIEAVKKELGIDLPPCRPVWGSIEHSGWLPPTLVSADASTTALSAAGADVSHLQYSTVLVELPSLIEGKALTLAASDPALPAGEPLTLDPEAVALLQRPHFMGLREYLYHLTDLGVIPLHDENGNSSIHDVNDGRPMASIVASFTALYEYARFSTDMLSHILFCQLMHDLAIILRCMRPIDESLLILLDEDDEDRFSRPARSSGDHLRGGGRGCGSGVTSGPGSDLSSLLCRRNNMSSELTVHLGTTETQQSTRLTYSTTGGYNYTDADDDDGARNPRRSISSAGHQSVMSSTAASNDVNRQHRRRHAQSLLREHLYAPAAVAATNEGITVLVPKLNRNKPRKLGLMQAFKSTPASTSASASSSIGSLVQSRRLYPINRSSASSLRSMPSSGSIIRLTERDDFSGPPYILSPAEINAAVKQV